MSVYSKMGSVFEAGSEQEHKLEQEQKLEKIHNNRLNLEKIGHMI